MPDPDSRFNFDEVKEKSPSMAIRTSLGNALTCIAPAFLAPKSSHQFIWLPDLHEAIDIENVIKIHP
jgi:hypothetical protein